MNEGLSHDIVRSVYEDGKGMLWMCTGNGITQFDPENESFKVFDENDGLAVTEYSEHGRHQATDGEIFCSGPGGGVSFYPDNVYEDTRIPEIFLTGLSVNGRLQSPKDKGVLKESIRIAEEITVPHGDNELTLQYAGVHPSESLEYEYTLENYDNDWIAAGAQTSVRYPRIPPGDYVFQRTSQNKRRHLQCRESLVSDHSFTSLVAECVCVCGLWFVVCRWGDRL